MGWPLGDLAAHWSLAALVLQRCVLVLAVAPLLLAGLPDDVLGWATRPAPVDAVLLRLVRPPVAVAVVTVLLVGSMVPASGRGPGRTRPRPGRCSRWSSLFAGIVLWLPVLGRVPGIPRPRPMIRAVYLVAQAVVPGLPVVPLHPVQRSRSTRRFSRSVRRDRGLRPLTDQQMAGFVSKLTFLVTC